MEEFINKLDPSKIEKPIIFENGLCLFNIERTDLLFDCDICEDSNWDKSKDFICKSCKKFACDKCKVAECGGCGEAYCKKCMDKEIFSRCGCNSEICIQCKLTCLTCGRDICTECTKYKCLVCKKLCCTRCGTKSSNKSIICRDCVKK